MKFWFRGHHYNSQIKYTVLNFRYWWNVVGFIKALWNGDKYLTWFGHEEDCCDYWTPVSDPRAQEAFMLDDELGFIKPKSKLEGDKR